tara:strand:+ start:163 stop:855 length:693 start_codon:yes stop_codon:yes gene_type:complete
MMRLFLISLGVTCLASVILFLYFRNRVGRMEQKVDLMFQLIQEYEQSKNIEAAQTFKPIPVNNTMQRGGSSAHDDLISVSDDDEDERDTDSEEVSDNEEEDEVEEELLQIQEPVENVKTISLSGAEIESLAVEPADDLDEISDLEEEAEEVITLEETNVDDIEDETDEVNEESVDNDNDESVTVKKIEVSNEKPLDKMTVKELKAKAEKDGFTNFKGLRKDKLVELLTSQ